MPKVLRIINRLNLGGPTYNAAYLSKYLEDEFETLLVAGMKDDSEASSEFITKKLGLKPRYIKNMHRSIDFRNDRKAYLEIRNIIREFKPDIVHTHAAKSGALGRLAAINEKVPIIIHTFHGHVFHSYFSSIKTTIFLLIERFLAKRSTKIIAISDKQLEELSDDFKIEKREKFAVIPLGFELEKFQESKEEKRVNFREKFNFHTDEIVIGIIGRLVPIKNHSLFLKAFLNVKKSTSKKIKGVIIGDGELKEKIFMECHELGLKIDEHNNSTTDIVFTSWIKDVYNILPGLDVVALSSLNEGTPVSLIEAQAAGVPIISTKVGGIEDVVIDNETALLSKNNDLEDFSEQFLQIIENDSLRKSMATKGYKNVQKKFSYKRLVSDMNRLYWKLIKEN